ncbi:MAG: ABC transporter ATP-binding protein [Candidatus Cloacimonetes bacterium]|nr:ABC transporter ATP-binding protein [Candidatus Cloacimonadota bacterium]
MEQHILRVENLSKKFNDFLAVNSLNFSVIKNEIFGFLGPNGAGKTTTINMLTGLARPTSGSIFINDKDYTANIKKAQEIIGIVPDESNLYEEMDGLENLCFCASLYGIKKAERIHRAKKLLQQFNLTTAGNKPYKSYSKGMKRKLTLAAGIIHEPGILFLDEPTTGIDVASARQIRALIKSLNEAGTTIFMTTHYIEEAERLCHRIAFIVNGQIIKIGKIDELMEDAQKDKIIQFSFDGIVQLNQFENNFNHQFSHCKLTYIQDSVFQIHSAIPLDLMPLISFFDSHGLKVTEARIIKPSLEEVFVKITGIERDVMKKEKEGRKK